LVESVATPSHETYKFEAGPQFGDSFIKRLAASRWIAGGL